MFVWFKILNPDSEGANINLKWNKVDFVEHRKHQMPGKVKDQNLGQWLISIYFLITCLVKLVDYVFCRKFT